MFKFWENNNVLLFRQLKDCMIDWLIDWYEVDRSRGSLSSLQVHHAHAVPRLFLDPTGSGHVPPRRSDAYHVQQRHSDQRDFRRANLRRRTGATRKDRISAQRVVPARQQAYHWNSDLPRLLGSW